MTSLRPSLRVRLGCGFRREIARFEIRVVGVWFTDHRTFSNDGRGLASANPSQLALSADSLDLGAERND